MPQAGKQLESAEGFVRFAIEEHTRRAVEATRALTRSDAGPGELELSSVRLTLADLLMWTMCLALDLVGQDYLKNTDARMIAQGSVDRRNPAHFMTGVYWARNEIAHGRAGLLVFDPAEVGDATWDSPEMLFDDPEALWEEDGRTPTIRFGERPGHDENKNKDMRRFYDECVAGRRALVVAGLLAGGTTLDGWRLPPATAKAESKPSR